MKLWPRTLGMQMIAVTAVAVALSNIAVAIWFELGSAQANESALIDRVLDRAASTATLLAVIPQKAREDAVRTLSSGVWSFSLHEGPYAGTPMRPDEAQLASRLRALLPPATANYPVFVDIRSPERPTSRKPPDEIGQTFQFTVPVNARTQVIAKFYRPATSLWPAEVLIAAIVAIIVASSAAAYFAQRVTRPLSELARAASAVAQGGKAPRLRENGPQDVRNAAIAFNAMTDEVTRTLESQRQLLSAVGHDLRTPITAMRISLEFVEDAEVRDRLLENLEELQELTEAVLSAARGTGGEVKRNVDLAALVESLCADLDDLGEPVKWSTHPPAPLSCRPNEIRRAVRNLVENAVSYGGSASVRLDQDGDGYEILVEDEGPGIPDADRGRVFEPFVRLEGSRNIATGGAGLGLTLVKAIAEGHGGRVVLENRNGGGLRARLRLPREAAPA
ncbi:MAG TPA: ATP-binding protein [Rhizomicrobium sp.]|jgi:signal transduction histidine kinase|nr:ATP-binding protein [Rhizomicrobium sp.]